jgi:hypothetical protein
MVGCLRQHRQLLDQPETPHPLKFDLPFLLKTSFEFYAKSLSWLRLPFFFFTMKALTLAIPHCCGVVPGR